MPPPRSSPTDDRDAGAFPRLGVNLELAGQAPRAAETEAEAAAGGVAIAHGELDIGDAGAFVLERQPQTAPPVIVDPIDGHGPAPAVLDGVARQLAGGGDDLGLIDQVETELDGALPDRLPYPHYVVRCPDRALVAKKNGHPRAVP